MYYRSMANLGHFLIWIAVLIGSGDGNGGGGKLIELTEASSMVANLVAELDRRLPVVVMTNKPGKDSDCPLSVCGSVKAIVVVPSRPRIFIACLPNNRQFCGLCPRGSELEHDEYSFRCAQRSTGGGIDEKTDADDGYACHIDQPCRTDAKPRLLIWTTENGTTSGESENATICSRKKSFCAFCPEDISTFNRTTLSCDFIFPETRVTCPDTYTARVMSDPLTACSPLAYVCIPGNNRAIASRCPNPKMRHSQSMGVCDLPQNVPECGGTAPIVANNQTDTDLPLNGTQQLARSGEPVANCVGHCIYTWYRPKNFCIRICTN